MSEDDGRSCWSRTTATRSTSRCAPSDASGSTTRWPSRDGVEALELLGLEDGGEDDETRAALAPRVVFLDLKMPRIDGWQVLERIRRDPRTADAGRRALFPRATGGHRAQLCAQGEQLRVSPSRKESGHYIARRPLLARNNRTPRQGV
ncbi:MAG: hypothetical protein R3E53_21930 [Myxococcota bacterium]